MEKHRTLAIHSMILPDVSLIIVSRFAVLDSIYLCDCELLDCLSLLELLGYCSAS